MKLLLGVVLLCAAATLGHARKPIPEYTIDLDKPPQDRFTELVPHYNASVWSFYNKFFAHDLALREALYLLTDKRGKENPELQAEVQGMADVSKLPLKFVQGIQMLYELQTLMVPIANFTGFHDKIPFAWKVLNRIPWHGPGCTGIIAKGGDGTVYHARNLDFAPAGFMAPLVYTGIFTKGGKELFRSQMIAGYSSMITGLKKGPNGFAIERNTRYTTHHGGNAEMLKNLLGGRPLNGWMLRKVLEEQPDYDAAVKQIRSMEYVSTEYTIVSGVKKGTIISRNPDDVAYTQALGQENMEMREDYIMITNFDFYFHDVREWFDPTGANGHGFWHPRRLAAQKMLNGTAVDTLTGEFLFEVINSKPVRADTIFQAIINVEKGIWNVSQPDLSDWPN